MFDQETIKILEQHLQTKINNYLSYDNYKNLEDSESGKNSDAVWVRSKKRVLWLYKPINNSYNSLSAIKEAFFGEMAVMLYGEDHAPKTKLTLKTKGIISKLIGQDFSITKDLQKFLLNDYIGFSRKSRLDLMNVMIFNTIIENRDIRLENIVVQYENREDGYCVAQKIYGIDYEYVAPNTLFANNIDLNSFLTIILNDYASLILCMFKDNLLWNVAGNTDACSLRMAQKYVELLTIAITQEEFVSSFQEMVDRISSNNFKIYEDVAKKIKLRLGLHKVDIYPTYEIDKIIAKQKENMLIIKKFIDQQPVLATANKNKMAKYS